MDSSSTARTSISTPSSRKAAKALPQ